MLDEDIILSSSEEHKDIPLEQKQLAPAESHEIEILPETSVKKPSTTPKAIRLATISKLLEKHTTQMDKVGRMVQPLQTQNVIVIRRRHYTRQDSLPEVFLLKILLRITESSKNM